MPHKDGSIDVELNPARLTQAIDSFKTSAAGEKTVIRSLSLEDINQAGEFLAANNQIAASLDNQVFNVGNDLMKSLQPPRIRLNRK